jgi:hypothetical protein
MCIQLPFSAVLPHVLVVYLLEALILLILANSLSNILGVIIMPAWSPPKGLPEKLGDAPLRLILVDL